MVLTSSLWNSHFAFPRDLQQRLNWKPHQHDTFYACTHYTLYVYTLNNRPNGTTLCLKKRVNFETV